MSLLKGFSSLFDWVFPSKSYQETSDDLDAKMQELYDRCGWGKYNNPLKGHQNAVDINRVLDAHESFRKELAELGVYNTMTVDEYFKKYNPCQFTPATSYSEDMDAIEVIFQNESFNVKNVNEALDLYIGTESGQVVGLNVLQIKKLMKEKFLQ
jgi:hypothetical protein